MTDLIRPPQVIPWQIRGGQLLTGQKTLIMGIVNVTPDSFSDGGRFLSVAAAVEQALQLEADGADLLDIGGESTRPGSEPVNLQDELHRVVPVIEALQGRVTIPISVDTSKAQVAAEALAAGAAIVNDISGLRFDPGMLDVCCESSAGVICMHMQGTPQTMQINPHYLDVVAEVRQFFVDRQSLFLQRGLSVEQLVWDPGVGFGKTAAHNVELLGSVAELRSLGRPVLIGHSRKGFLKKLIGREIDERLFGTLGVSLAVAAQGADIIRVHDVAAHRDALAAFQAATP